MRTAHDFQRELITVSARTPVWEVADEMDAYSVGAVLIVDDAQHPVGIVTDRDLLCRVVAEGGDPETTTAGDVMTKDPVCVEEFAPLAEVVQTMRDRSIRRLPTLREGRVSGIVSFDDLLFDLSAQLMALNDAVKVELRESRRTAPRRRRSEMREEAVEDALDSLRRLGANAGERIRDELRELSDRLGLRR